MNSKFSAADAGRSDGNSNSLVLAGASLALGVTLTGAWFHYHQSPSAPARGELAVPTRDSLEHLAAPVNIRFYSVLPAGSASEELQSFSGRVEHLLNAVQNAGDGKIQVTYIDASGETNADAASADGIQAFNLDKGDACFLGVAISSGAHKESLARLQPEWEPALQYDLARAILRVAATPDPARPALEIAKPSRQIVSSIHRLIPDISAISVEDADQVFHAEFLKDCAVVGSEMETQINAAQQQVVQAQNNGSPGALAAAQKHLLEVQLQQGEKMKQIAADLQTRLAVFEQMKASVTNSAK